MAFPTSRPAIVALLCAGLGLVPPALEAQQALRDDPRPAEIPPESFQGNQYVDSEGCVFIRAGIDGAVTWVPRVTRSRELVCGFQPTNLPGATPSETVAAPPGQGAVINSESATAPAGADVTEARPQTRPAQQMPRAPETTARPGVLPQILPAPASPPPAMIDLPGAPIATLRDPAQVQTRADGTTRRIPGREVRFYAGESGARRVTDRTIIAPLAAARNARNGLQTVPPGYKPAFEDDRLNPFRGFQTLEGRRQMQQVWTNTTPGELLD